MDVMLIFAITSGGGGGGAGGIRESRVLGFTELKLHTFHYVSSDGFVWSGDFRARLDEDKRSGGGCSSETASLIGSGN